MGHKLGTFDQHTVGPTGQPPPTLAGFFYAAKGLTLPQIVVRQGGEYRTFDLPTDPDATVALLEGL